MNKQERALRFELVRKALTTAGALEAVVELVEAALADDDCNNIEAHERVHSAVRALLVALGYREEA